MKSYICPACKEKQETAIEWQTASIAWEHDLETDNSEEIDRISGDHEDWTCPACGEELPQKLCEKIEKQLGWT